MANRFYPGNIMLRLRFVCEWRNVKVLTGFAYGRGVLSISDASPRDQELGCW